MNEIKYVVKYDNDIPRTIIETDGSLGSENTLFLYETTTKLVLNIYTKLKDDKDRNFSSEHLEEFKTTFETLVKITELSRDVIKAQNHSLNQARDILNNNDDEV